MIAQLSRPTQSNKIFHNHTNNMYIILLETIEDEKV